MDTSLGKTCLNRIDDLLEKLLGSPRELQPVTTAPADNIVSHPVTIDEDTEVNSALRTFYWVQEQNEQYEEQCSQNNENNQPEPEITKGIVES